jgi:hypothetical protein
MVSENIGSVVLAALLTLERLALTTYYSTLNFDMEFHAQQYNMII